MDSFLFFCKELHDLVSIKPELFEPNPLCDENLKKLEHENNIQLPEELKLYYQVTGKQEKIYQRSIFNFWNPQNLTVQHHEKYGKYILFCQNIVPYYYGYFFDDKTVRAFEDQNSRHSILEISYILMYILSNAVIHHFNHTVLVKLKYSQAKIIDSAVTSDGVKYTIKDYPAFISEKLSLTNIASLNDFEETAFYDTERKIFAYFDFYGSNKLLLACDDAEILESAVKDDSFVWRKKNGKKIQNPSKFIKGECPKSFEEKLDMIRQIIPYAGKVKYQVAKNGLPECLNYFYRCFSKTQGFFESDMQITPFSQIDNSKEYFHFAYENQGLFCYAIKLDTNEVWITYDEKEYEKLPFSLEDLLILVACRQAVTGELMNVLCEVNKNDVNELLPFFFELFGAEEIHCYANPTRKILMLCDKDSAYISARTDWYMNTLEEDSGVEFNYL